MHGQKDSSHGGLKVFLAFLPLIAAAVCVLLGFLITDRAANVVLLNITIYLVFGWMSVAGIAGLFLLIRDLYRWIRSFIVEYRSRRQKKTYPQTGLASDGHLAGT